MAEKKKPTEEKEDKTCFVIMPISDAEGYDAGHFRRVYEHIIKPACRDAGFEPLRADDINTTNHIIIDILKRIIEADMAICDLSGRNPNVLYELGIRQAFNRPVTLIKDEKTSRIFDIQTLRDVPYDSSLRIDTIEQVIPNIAEAIKSTYENKDDSINSIIQLLGIESAKVTKTEISEDTGLLLDAINNLGKRLSRIEDGSNIQTKPLSVYEGGSRGVFIYLTSDNNKDDIVKAYDIVRTLAPRNVISSNSEPYANGYRLIVFFRNEVTSEFLESVVEAIKDSGIKVSRWSSLV